MVHCSGAVLNKRKDLRFVNLHKLRDAVEAPGPEDRGQFPRSLTNHVSYGQVHPEFAVEADSEQFYRNSIRLGVGHDVHRFLRWVKRDLVCSAPFVQLSLTLLGFSQDGVDAGIVCELFETI